MLTHTFYKNLQEKDKMYGLELIDIYILIFFFNISFLINSSFLTNVILTAILFSILRIYKRNKPKNFTTDLINYLRMKKTLILHQKDIVGRYPFKRL